MEYVIGFVFLLKAYSQVLNTRGLNKRGVLKSLTLAEWERHREIAGG